MSSFDNNCILTPIPTGISEDGSGTPDNSLPFGSNRPKKDLDKFYTKEEIALECYSTLKDNVDIDLYDFHLEPSAGGGSFYKLLDPSKAVGIDIDPPYVPTVPTIKAQAVHGEKGSAYATELSPPSIAIAESSVPAFRYGTDTCGGASGDRHARAGIIKMDFLKFKPKENKKYLIIGNPPFGRSSSIAIKFFNKAALFSDCIAFILPRTFKRVSIQNRLDLNFSLIYTKDLPVKPCCFIPKMEAKCCFQI